MNTKNYAKFCALHDHNAPLQLVNIWDAAGARILSKMGAKAIATSSAAIAWSLGYADGYQMPQEQLLAAIERIIRVTELPVTIDIENGYSDVPETVATLCSTLTDMGVVGINLEDGLQPAEGLSDKISAINAMTSQLFINARTDVFLHNASNETLMSEETLRRAHLYRAAGANGLFVPGLSNLQIARTIAQQIQLPLNLMVTQQDDMKQARQASIARISMGPAPFLMAYSGLIALQDDSAQHHTPLQYETMQNYLG
ncbi:isocitrate lyase/PEP mutase family protein [Planctobacterium marinum]|uniref:isocitrate lyase/PEP mutase family protein n=1 Tax=Planctobacterium marinum TaxID=1631968 RepID=UPI001E65B9C5|nr:isocitrate lyase/phosphoenolpyruvate mutase family protein [Planctobacterium marinum]MCC2605428.1 isocitrate lyase/phosphoenolpyruvate mutase family protein [Planctobacterium marinum]